MLNLLRMSKKSEPYPNSEHWMQSCQFRVVVHRHSMEKASLDYGANEVRRFAALRITFGARHYRSFN